MPWALLVLAAGCGDGDALANEEAADGSPEPLADERAYVGATLVDGTGAEPVEDAVLHVAEGRVVCAGAREDCAVPGDAEATDLEGRWIVPGLVDAHVHYAQTGWADGRPDGFDVTEDHPFDEVVARQRQEAAVTHRSYLCSGVTAVFDVGGFPWTLGLRQGARPPLRIPRDASVEGRDGAVGDARGAGPEGPGLSPPHVAATGPLLTWVEPRLSLPAEQSMVQVEDEGAGREAVGYVDAFDADAAKVWFLGAPEERRQELDAVVASMGREAAERDLPLAVHATSLREAEVAVEAGADMLVHSVSDEPVGEAFLEAARRQGTIYVPTLLVSANWGELAHHAALEEEPELDDPLGCVDPGTRERIRSTPAYGEHPAVGDLTASGVEERRAAARSQLELMQENLRRVHEAGVPVAAGTDAGNPLTVHGAAIHPELEAMQEAGLEPGEVLETATRNGARALGRNDELGTLEEGKVADFLVLEADPLEDIGNLRELTHVARNGRLLPQEDLAFR